MIRTHNVPTGLGSLAGFATRIAAERRPLTIVSCRPRAHALGSATQKILLRALRNMWAAKEMLGGTELGYVGTGAWGEAAASIQNKNEA